MMFNDVKYASEMMTHFRDDSKAAKNKLKYDQKRRKSQTEKPFK